MPLAALAVNVACAQSAQAEPLTPLTPAELQYLDQARRVLSVSHDPLAFRSDGELLVDGRFACDKRATGMVGYEATLVAPALTQLAFIYLCPQ
ncbi:hypothetical protein [Mycobacterium antarcticum]|uniref:hypothetical protein n=1 Tax=Mycolicibacterium sp. TUM20984 TaxID=3023368 RepID=UPI0024E07252|nr:hypothetical protein [Mycolicibacterium sp. TUM20984]